MKRAGEPRIAREEKSFAGERLLAFACEPTAFARYRLRMKLMSIPTGVKENSQVDAEQILSAAVKIGAAGTNGHSAVIFVAT